MVKKDPVRVLILGNALNIARMLSNINDKIHPGMDYTDPRLIKAKKALKKAYFELLYLEHTISLDIDTEPCAIRPLPMFKQE